MNDIPDNDAHAILEQVARLQNAHRCGEETSGLHDELVDRYGIQTIAEVMAQRDELERLGAEVTLLRVFGARALYGHE